MKAAAPSKVCHKLNRMLTRYLEVVRWVHLVAVFEMFSELLLFQPNWLPETAFASRAKESFLSVFYFFG